MTSPPSQSAVRLAIALDPLVQAVEQTADHVIITDKNGVIEYVNPAFEKFTGFPRNESIGRTPRIVNSGQHDAKFFGTLWHTIWAGRVFRAVFTNRKKNGQLYYEDKTITPIKDSAGNIIHFVSTGRDITERKRIESERERLIRELQEALAKVKTLSGLLPICAWCKRIRDDQGCWNQIEIYIRSRSNAQFTHSICPSCAQKLSIPATQRK